jgi:hypothetical protein
MLTAASTGGRACRRDLRRDDGDNGGGDLLKAC